MARMAVVGGGAWGTALAAHAARLGHTVWLWARETEVIDDVNVRHANAIFLPGVNLPESLRASSDLGEAAGDAEVVILVPPSQHVRTVSNALAKVLRPGTTVVVASKGIEEQALELLSVVLRETLPTVDRDHLAFLSGPSFAREVAQGLPTDVAIASEGMVAARRVQPLLHAPMFRVYTSADPVGVQVGGAIKNVMAVATGACDGLGFGLNARAAVITRGLAEMTRLGVALGADPLTFLGMAGVGDLILTCTGDLSRNRTLGLKIATGIDAKTYLASQRSVAEGYYTAAAAHALAKKLGVEMPITEQVHAVLHEGRPLQDAVRHLLAREYKEELRGIVRA